MKFVYESQFRQAFRPGDRTWASGFRVASNGRKIIRNREPALVEICAGHKREDEDRLRADERPPAYVVPVNADGTLCFKDACTWTDIEFSDTEAEARANYGNAVLAAHAAVGYEIKRLRHVKSRIKEVIKGIGIDPDSLEGR